MKKRYTFMVLMSICFINTYAQEASKTHNGASSKPPIAIDSLGKWERVSSEAGLSPDGNYAYYEISPSTGRSFWKLVRKDGTEIFKTKAGGTDPSFSSSGKLFLCHAINDSIIIFSLLREKIIAKYQGQSGVFIDNNKGETLVVCRQGNNLILANPLTNQTFTINNVEDWMVSKKPGRLLIKNKHLLGVFDVNTYQTSDLVRFDSLLNYRQYDQFNSILLTIRKDNFIKNFIVGYGGSIEQSFRLPDTDLMPSGFELNYHDIELTSTTTLSVAVVKKSIKLDNKLRVKVLKYTDKTLPFGDQIETDQNSTGQLLYSIKHASFYKMLAPGSVCDDISEDYTVVRDNIGSGDLLKNDTLSSLMLISNKNGKVAKIFELPRYFDGSSRFKFSTDGKYLVFTGLQSRFFSYDIVRDKLTNLSMQIPSNLFYRFRNEDASFGWYISKTKPSDVLIYDEFDCWKVDLTGKVKPFNIFGGFGSKNNLILGIVGDPANTLLSPNKRVLLTAYNPLTKENGIGFLRNGKIKLNMHDQYLYVTRNNDKGFDRFPYSPQPIKAIQSESYLVMTQSATKAPNWFITKDFSRLVPISNNHPQKRSNWLNAELINWNAEYGQHLQGVLYKPEDFDSTKKYPVIINYYTRVSDQFHKFLYPEYIGSNIDIPYFVSNGYIIIVADLYFEAFERSKSTIRSIIPLIDMLSKRKWIDQQNIGIQGHSHGGYVTNCLITETNLFKAACEFAGVSNLVSSYGQLNKGRPRHALYETSGQSGTFGYGATPWNKPNLYIKNSPIFKINMINTPLLMIHGNNDDLVPFAQAEELFTGMRREGKPVWWLQYQDDGGHVLFRQAERRDLTVRMKEYFDHYLKDKPMPEWMATPGNIGLDLTTN
jgi:predicted esterase